MLGGAAAAAILNGRDLLPNGKRPERVAEHKAPRFIPEKAKLARQRNRQTFVRMPTHESSLVYSSQGLQNQRGKSRSQISVHASDNDGSVRLFSKAANNSRLEKLQLDEADRWIQASEELIRTRPQPSSGSVRELPLGAQRTSPLEALALQHLQNRNLDAACDILMLGARLTTRVPSSHPINVRLLDLLAGLAVRSGQQQKYLDPLIVVLNDRIKQLDAIAQKDRKYPQRALLVSRIAKWRNSDSKWAKRWTNREARVTWHHPYELENRSSTGTLKSRVRHQRSVEIA